MKYLVIEDSHMTFKASSALLEELLVKGADQFSFVCSGDLTKTTELLLSLLDESSKVERIVETLYFNDEQTPWSCESSLYVFDRASLSAIKSCMGHHLLCSSTHLTKGLSNWHFYKEGKLLAGANADDDFFALKEPSHRLLSELQTMCIPYTFDVIN